MILPTLARFVREIFETTPLLRVTSEEEMATNIAISCENARDEVLELS